MLGISWLAEDLLASKEGLCYMELVIYDICWAQIMKIEPSTFVCPDSLEKPVYS
jgi:hypothetical protein